MQSLCKYVMNSFCLVCCMWACLCWPKQYLYLLYVFQTEHFLLSSWSSDGCYGSETAKKIPRISRGGKKMVPLRFAERSCLWHHSHSPMISLTLLLCWVHAVPLVCLYGHMCQVFVFFSHLLWFATKHCNLEPTPSFLFLRVPWLSLTERCVLYWHAFCMQGLLTQPQDHLE